MRQCDEGLRSLNIAEEIGAPNDAPPMERGSSLRSPFDRQQGSSAPVHRLQLGGCLYLVKLAAILNERPKTYI
jgi:hypothetical protein